MPKRSVARGGLWADARRPTSGAVFKTPPLCATAASGSPVIKVRVIPQETRRQN